MCLLEKVHVLDKLHSSLSYSLVGHEVNVNKTMNNEQYILNKVTFDKKHPYNKAVYLLVVRKVVTEAHRNQSLYFP